MFPADVVTFGRLVFEEPLDQKTFGVPEDRRDSMTREIIRFFPLIQICVVRPTTLPATLTAEIATLGNLFMRNLAGDKRAICVWVGRMMSRVAIASGLRLRETLTEDVPSGISPENWLVERMLAEFGGREFLSLDAGHLANFLVHYWEKV